MAAMVKEHPGLWDNTRSLITDRCPAQVKANILLCDLMNETRSAPNLVFVVCCLMHTVLGADNRSGDCLSDEAKTVASCLKQTFGGRHTDGYRKSCLKEELKQAVGIPSEFVTDIGSRFGVRYQNGKALMLREGHVREVLSLEKATRPVHAKLRGYMDKPAVWRKVKLELQIPVLVWAAVIGPFHTVISGEATFKQMRTAFDDALGKVGLILTSKSPFAKALELAMECPHDPASTTPAALEAIDKVWKATAKTLVATINKVTSEAFKEVKAKFGKDDDSMYNLPLDDDEVLSWTNRRVESTFAFLKAVDRRYSTMTTENIQMVSMAIQNHLSAWIISNGESISSVGAHRAYLELREKRAQQFTLQWALDNFN